MTRATRQVRDKEGYIISKPTVRTVVTMDGFMIAELNDHTLTLRPVGRKRGGPTEVTISWGKLYIRAMMDKVDAEKAAKRKARKEARRK